MLKYACPNTEQLKLRYQTTDATLCEASIVINKTGEVSPNEQEN